MKKRMLIVSIGAVLLFSGCNEDKTSDTHSNLSEKEIIVGSTNDNTVAKSSKLEDKIIEEKTPKSVIVKTKTGTELYVACSGCHGKTGQLKALGKSKIIAHMTHDDLVLSLYGYQKGTYGGNMKGVMKGQVANLSVDDIKTISKYILTFK